jgi:hypothetical protein
MLPYNACKETVISLFISLIYDHRCIMYDDTEKSFGEYTLEIFLNWKNFLKYCHWNHFIRQAERGFAKEASVYFLYLDSVLFCTVHYATLPFRHSAILPSCHSAILPFRHSAIPPFRHSAISPFRHSVIPSFRHSAIPLQYAITRCMYHRRC